MHNWYSLTHKCLWKIIKSDLNLYYAIILSVTYKLTYNSKVNNIKQGYGIFNVSVVRRCVVGGWISEYVIIGPLDFERF